MDDIRYQRDNNLNILTLTKNISVTSTGDQDENSLGKNKAGYSDPVTGTL